MVHAFVLRGVPPTDHRVDDGAVAVSHGAMLIATGVPTDPVEPFPVLPVRSSPTRPAGTQPNATVARSRPASGAAPPDPSETASSCAPHHTRSSMSTPARRARPWTASGPPCLRWAALDSGSAGPALVVAFDGTSLVTGELAAEVRQTVPGYTTAMNDQDPTP